MQKLKGRVAIITGSGRGIGRALALILAEQGARVIVNDLDEDPANDVVDEIRGKGGEAVACAGSVVDKGFPARIVKLALDTFGDLHIVVNNAGYTWDNVIQKMTDEQFDAMIDVHLRAPWALLREAADVFRSKSKEEKERGEEVIRKVVNISSLTGTRGNVGQSNYAAAKSGLIGMTRSLAKEWGRYNVNVNAVAFGLIETRLTEASDSPKTVMIEDREIAVGIPKASLGAALQQLPMGRPGRAEEAAGAVSLFCLPESNYVSGQYLEVTGGY